MHARHTLVIVGADVVAPATAATAAAAPSATTATKPPDDYRPVGDQAEVQSAETLLVSAYAIIWIILFAVVAFAYLRTRALDGRLAVLESALAKASGGKPSPAKASGGKPATASKGAEPKAKAATESDAAAEPEA